MLDLTPLWISMKTSLTATAITFFLGLAVAYWMAHYKGRLKGIIDGLLILPMVLPPTVVGFILLLVFGKNSFIGGLLANFDITVVFTWWATVIAATVVAFPLMYKTARGAFEQVDMTYIEAARTLGYHDLKIFWKVVLPLAWPGIAAGTILSFARALGEFGATLMLAGSIPGKTQTVPIAIYFASEGGNMDQAFIWVMIIISISLMVVVLSNLWTTKRYSTIGRVRGDR
ncbi:molybdate ABC transporter permease subunit [Halalkalibacter krulwichiae]|uniref:Molybdenum transport system permease n=1 Tax=Halalkalibacter krulwichiae TaxID=199441 RepID=A0A1X9MGG4_9BACI|nr:molybdate ABC transporter permease subunit [Halalkalibacter krulwichiae]ARK32528.1 Molybdenum transport system permease protein ModB [Halalkalibacter krulwichiae]